MDKLVIIGAGGFGRETKALVDEINEIQPTWDFIGYVDDSGKEETLEGDNILCSIDEFVAMEDKPYAVIAIANNHARALIAEKCYAGGVKFATLVHPNVKKKGSLTSIGEGSIVCDGCIFAVNSHIGKHCILNMNCGIGHDTTMKDYSSMMSYTITGGDTVIGSYCYFGLRCTIINKIEICDDCTFGAAACVVKNATEPGTYVGVPAKLIKPLAK